MVTLRLRSTFIAHRDAKHRLEVLKNPDVVIPDVAVDDRHNVTLGDVKLELYYVERNHPDDSLVMRVPQDRIMFAVDFLPIVSARKTMFGTTRVDDGPAGSGTSSGE